MEPLDGISSPVNQLPPEAALMELRHQRAVIIDVREPNEFQREHIAGAISVPLSELSPQRLPDGKTAVLYCGAGKRCSVAARRLAEEACPHVAVVEGGIAGWKAAGLPTDGPSV